MAELGIRRVAMPACGGPFHLPPIKTALTLGKPLSWSSFSRYLRCFCLYSRKEEREKEKRKKENSRTLVPLNCFFLGKWMCRRSLKISRYRITSYYRELLKMYLIKKRKKKRINKKFAIPRMRSSHSRPDLPQSSRLGRQILFHHAVGREDSCRSPGEFYAGVNVAALAWAYVPIQGKRNAWERIPASTTLRTQRTIDWRWFTTRVNFASRAFASAISVPAREPVQSELRRFINLE